MRSTVTQAKPLWSAVLLLAASACSAGGTQSSRYTVLVRVADGLGQALSGVKLSAAGVDLGATDAMGQRTLSLPGTEGERVDLSAVCPPGYTGPRERPAFLLDRVRDARGEPTDQPIVVSLTCDASSHVALVAVQTGQPGMTILRGGQPVAQTSSAGTAHVMLREAPGTPIALTLDTSDKPELRPQSPTRTFTVTTQDAFAVWDQTFERERKRRASSRRRRKARQSSASLPPPEPR